MPLSRMFQVVVTAALLLCRTFFIHGDWYIRVSVRWWKVSTDGQKIRLWTTPLFVDVSVLIYLDDPPQLLIWTQSHVLPSTTRLNEYNMAFIVPLRFSFLFTLARLANIYPVARFESARVTSSSSRSHCQLNCLLIWKHWTSRR